MDKEAERWRAKIAELRIELTDDRATIDYENFRKLDNYSCTIPDGTVDYKIWRRHEPYYGRGCWVLGQYLPSDSVKIVWRELWVYHPVTGAAMPATDDNLDRIASQR